MWSIWVDDGGGRRHVFPISNERGEVLVVRIYHVRVTILLHRLVLHASKEPNRARTDEKSVSTSI